MAITNPTTANELDYSAMSTQEILDQFEAELDRHPGLPQGLVWEIVSRVAAAENIS